MAYELTALPLGLCVGVVLWLTGAGGTVLSVPLLTLVLGLPIVEAAPIGLFAVMVSAGLGAAIALGRRILRYKAALLIASIGSLASPVGVALARRLPELSLTIGFALLLFWIGVNTWRKAWEPGDDPAGRRKPPPCRLNPQTGRLRWTMPCARALSGAGVLAGFLSGLLGVGGGFIVVPSLRRYTDLPMDACVATSMGVLMVVSAMGVAVSATHAPLNFAVGLPFITGTVTGMLFGRHWSNRLTGPNLQRAFALLCLGVAVSLSVSVARTFL